MSRIAIIAALPGELKPLVRGWSHESRGGIDLWRYSRRDSEWIAACAGIGVEAAARAFGEIEKGGPVHRIFSVGWAGAMRENLKPGHAYRISGVIDAETGERFATSAPAGEAWLLTSRTVLAEAEKRRLAAGYGASLVDMEAAALARIAARRAIPFEGIKAVSDGLTDRLPDLDRFISAQGKFRLGAFVGFALLRPGDWPALLRLRRHSGKAAEGIKSSLLAILEKHTP